MRTIIIVTIHEASSEAYSERVSSKYMETDTETMHAMKRIHKNVDASRVPGTTTDNKTSTRLYGSNNSSAWQRLEKLQIIAV